ncbi:n-terminal domain protein [Ichthyophthirius multifiliis]|uniref:N-terminal domain protein n=1 Tax=Ichthyophthirius multifiliis TaxID=5932 RepID=G0QXP8_ICHMU|nr:n-terminal domain protein [Ichthyophthirius multifiliis]EGR29985.1 n-terminal domain protein [Ichthyophthirius multifiliis]|eukprot:XP_004031221.1 n-terminal domain protein [Ichthyophthirius multifiliis]
MDKTRIIQNTQNLNKALQHLLNSFEKNKDWSSVGKWLQKVEQALKENPSPYIEDRINFCKRLAQCLNPELPEAINLAALRIYENIFKNMQSVSNNNIEEYVKIFTDYIGVYSIGLFPFFSNGQLRNKFYFLNMIKKYYIPLGKDLIPCAPGLVLSILPGLDENNQELLKEIHEIYTCIMVVCGRKYFIGSFWMAIMRSDRGKGSGIKYLSKIIPKFKNVDNDDIKQQQNKENQQNDKQQYNQENQQKENDNEEIQNYQQNNKQEGFEQNQSIENEQELVQTQQQTNEVQKKIPNKRTTLRDNIDRIKQNIYHNKDLLYLEKDIDENNLENNYPNKSTVVVNTILSCIEYENVIVKRNIIDFLQSHLPAQNDDILSENEKIQILEGLLYLFIKKDISVIRRANIWLFGKPDDENKFDFSTDRSRKSIKLVTQAFQNLLNKNIKEDFKSIKDRVKVLQNFFMEHDEIIEQILKKISSYMIAYIYKSEKNNPQNSHEIIKIGQRLVESLGNHIEVILNSISLKILEGVYENKNIENGNDNNFDDQECSNRVIYLDFLFESLLKCEEVFNEEIAKVSLGEIFKNIFQAINYIPENKIQQSKFIEESMKIVNKILKRYSHLSSIQNLENQIDIYSSFYVKMCKDVQNQSLYQLVCENLIKLQKYDKNFKEKMLELPLWFKSISNSISSENPFISLIAIESTIEILINEKTHPVYERLKELMVQNSKQIKQEVDYTQIMLQKLWSLLDFQDFYTRIIELIVNFCQYFPHMFKQALSDSFSSIIITQKEIEICRFSTFWQLTNTNNKYQNENLNIIHLQEINQEGLFLMIDFLEDENPLIRSAAKNWLVESFEDFARILIPLFRVLEASIEEQQVYVSDSQQIIYIQPYNTKRIAQCFKKFKTIIGLAGDIFINFLKNNAPNDNAVLYQLDIQNQQQFQQQYYQQKQQQQQTQFLQEQLIQEQKNQNQEEKQQENLQVNQKKKIQISNYLEYLSIICMRFMQAQVLESQNLQFYAENQQINASACEIFELLIVHLDDAEECSIICQQQMEKILKLLRENIKNKDYVMQVQILNLLKVMFFNPLFHMKTVPKIIKVLDSNLFIPTIVKGLNTPIVYVRGQFIYFISVSVPFLCEILVESKLVEVIKQIMSVYYQLIKELSQKNNQYEKVDNKIEIDKNDDTEFEIQSVLEGVRLILKHFLKIRTLEEIEEAKKNEYQTGFFDIMASFLSLGIYSPYSNTGKDKKIREYNDVCNCLLYDIMQIVELFVNSWQCQTEFLYEFNSYGIRCYDFEKYNTFNNKLGEIIKGTQQVKLVIIQIIKPLFFEFPNEIMNSFIVLWNRECAQQIPQKHEDFKPNIFLNKMVQLLIVMDIQCEVFFDAISKSFVTSLLDDYYKEKKNQQLNNFLLQFEIGQLETNLLFLIYTYLVFIQIEPQTLKKEKLLLLWGSILKIANIFINSKNPNTVTWLVELLFMASKKYNPKEIISDSKFKKELHDLLNEKLLFMSFWVSQSKFNVKFSNDYQVIAPFPPSIYELQQTEEIPPKSSEEERYELLFNPNIQSNNQEIQIYNKYRLQILQIFKYLGLEVLQNCYSAERTDRIIVRVLEFMEDIFLVIENKALTNTIYMESASELLYMLLDKCPILLTKDMKKHILSIFNKDNFFSCSKENLKYWGKIINWLIQYDKMHDLFTEYLSKVTLISSFFSKEQNENKKRIKAFKRVCFIVFAGEKDKYATKIQQLLDKISEVIKNSENAHPSLLILILFCIRILILRLSPSNLNELFQTIWPMLLTLLIQIYSKPTPGQQQKKDALMLAGLKVIELLSMIELDEFYLHQWMFAFDYFGIKIEEDKNSEKISPFIFLPYIANCINKGYGKVNYVNQEFIENLQKEYAKRERKIVIKGENDINMQTFRLCEELIKNNELRSEIVFDEIERGIEDDFINIDESILKV